MDIASESKPSDIEDYHPWPHLKTFIGPVVKKEAKENSKTGRSGVVKGTILCKMCNRTFSITTESLYSLKSHHKKVWFREEKCTDETGSVDSCFLNVSFATCKWPMFGYSINYYTSCHQTCIKLIDCCRNTQV